jgi:hypothetical protein
MNLKKEIFERISAIEKVELSETKKIELAMMDDIKEADVKLKQAMIAYGDLKPKFEKAKNDFKIEADKAFNVALKYNSMANELGLKAIDNANFKAIDSYLASDLYRNINK